MTLCELTDAQRHLNEGGLRLRIGPFTVCLRSNLASVADALTLLYADYEVGDPAGFADFHIRLAPPAGVRRWFRPQVLFSFDQTVPFKPLPQAHAFPLFEWGLNWCVGRYGHRFLILHAAVLERDGRALIMPARPGAGKSTLCAALAARGGWRLLSDELALIRLDDGLVVPIPRPVCLKNDSIDIIRAYAPDVVFGPESADTNKGTVAHMRAPRASVEKAAVTAIPGWVVFPQFKPLSPPRLEERSRGAAFMETARNAFNYSLLGERGFRTLSRLIGSAGCYGFSYSELDDALAVFDELASAPAGDRARLTA